MLHRLAGRARGEDGPPIDALAGRRALLLASIAQQPVGAGELDNCLIAVTAQTGELLVQQEPSLA
jgi:hypothetical protein